MAKSSLKPWIEFLRKTAVGIVSINRRLEFLLKAGLLENGVRGVSRFDFRIHGDIAANHRTEPDLMVTFAGTDEVAASFAEKPLQLRREIGHLSEGTAVSSALRQFVLARNELE